MSLRLCGVACGVGSADVWCGRRVALLVQIHLSQNRLDLAAQEVRRARSWAQDNLVVNLAESWVGLREVYACHLSEA